MFDGQEPIESKMWRKLAMNLLYARPSKNIVTNYEEKSQFIRKATIMAYEPSTPASVRTAGIASTKAGSVMKAKPVRTGTNMNLNSINIASGVAKNSDLPRISSLIGSDNNDENVGQQQYGGSSNAGG